MAAAAVGLAVGSVPVMGQVVMNASTSASAPATDARSQVPTAIELAQAFTAALNEHDIDALVELFTDEDSGPTINADRSAWQKFEIHLWAQQQALANVHVEASGYRTTEHGATWNADVYRDDWRASGVEVVPVTNTLWVHNGRLADFTSTPTDSRDLERLGALWRTAAARDRPAITDEPAPAGESIVRGNPGGCIGEPRHVHCRGRAM